VVGAGKGDEGLDTLLAHQCAGVVVVVAPVGIQRAGTERGRPRFPRTSGIASINGISWVTSLRFPPVSDTASGMPCASVIRWCFEPVLARSTGLAPVLGRL
jgi:hypothetical protein